MVLGGGKRWITGRVLRRYLMVFLLWITSCYLVLHFSYQSGTSLYKEADSINTRLLLQRVVETKVPLVTPTTEMDLLAVEPLLDKSKKSDEKSLLPEIQSQIPNLPIMYWSEVKNKGIGKNKTCAKYPNLYELVFNNVYWQTMYTSNGTFMLYGAYYDNRTLLQLKPIVRVLSMVDRLQLSLKTYCHLWFEGEKQPVIVQVNEYKYMWVSKWGNYKQGILQPYLISCRIPQGYKHRIPLSVSLVESPCNTATNNLRVTYENPGAKKDFAVCVKGLDFLDDWSIRMVEWLELLKLLGADKVFMYDLETHPNITKVLKYYQSTGFVDVRPITLPGGQPNIKGLLHMYLKSKVNNKRQNELIPYNDCLYRNMYRYKYLVLLDIDEVIMPVQTGNWKELMQVVEEKSLKIKNISRASYNVRNVYFLDDLLHSHGWFKSIPRFTHMLQHVFRTQNFTKPGQYVKCFHNPERVLTLHNHFPLACIGGGCTSYPINTTDAQLQHYRSDCVSTLKKTCGQYRNHTVLDTTIWRYKDQLIQGASNVLNKLGFFPVANSPTGGRSTNEVKR